MKTLFVVISIFLCSFSVFSQKLSTNWEELTASDFTLAVKQSEGVCIIPMGVIEKHGQHLPLGTDVFIAREVCRRAVDKEYCIVYPLYYMGQILEGKHQPGTIAYSSDLLLKMLDETCKEIARNGIKKIILANFHGGNNNFVNYFAMIQMESPRDYAVYVLNPSPSQEVQKQIQALRKTTLDQHAGEVETSNVLVIRPDIVKMNRVSNDSGRDQGRFQHMPSNIFTGLKWYASFPNHYAGDAKDANVAIGELDLEGSSVRLAEAIKAIKADQVTPRLQNEFFKESLSPHETKIK